MAHYFCGESANAQPEIASSLRVTVFAKARMAIPAHDQKIGTEIRALTQEGFGDVGAGDNAGLRCDAMKGKMVGQVDLIGFEVPLIPD